MNYLTRKEFVAGSAALAGTAAIGATAKASGVLSPIFMVAFFPRRSNHD